MKNYLEKLKITIEIENLTHENQINPTIKLGLNKLTDENSFQLCKGFNTISFSDIVYENGSQELILQVKEIENAYDIGAFKIYDLKIHGLSVGLSLFQCKYIPHYDQEYLDTVDNLPLEIKSGLYIGNRGTWKWYFKSPIYDNQKFKIGFW